MSAPHAAWLPQGTVYGTLLNFRREWDLWAPRMGEAPYKAAPKAPVLYIKTANTFAAHGSAIAVPGEVEVGAALGLIASTDSMENSVDVGMDSRHHATQTVAVASATHYHAVLLADLSLPHASYYRPPIQYRNRDGFLGCGPDAVPLRDWAGVGALQLELRINGELRQTTDLSTLLRDAATLLADVGEFMTLQPGDVLMLGTDCLPDGTRPRAKAGDRIEIAAAGFAPLAHTLIAEAA